MAIKFDKNISPIPLIPVRVGKNNNTVYAMIDTGSEISLFDYGIIGSLDVLTKESNQYELHMMSMLGEKRDESPKIAKAVLHPVGSEEKGFEMIGALSDLSSLSEYFRGTYKKDVYISILIGSDVLSDNKAIIDYLENKINFCDTSRKQ